MLITFDKYLKDEFYTKENVKGNFVHLKTLKTKKELIVSIKLYARNFMEWELIKGGKE